MISILRTISYSFNLLNTFVRLHMQIKHGVQLIQKPHNLRWCHIRHQLCITHNITLKYGTICKTDGEVLSMGGKSSTFRMGSFSMSPSFQMVILVILLGAF